MGKIHPNAEPFFYNGDRDIACLLIHGFTGSPADLRELGKEINQQGYTVSGLLLPGHGTVPEELATTSWQDWYGAVEKEYLRLTRNYERIIVIGFSMGGLLALRLAAKHKIAGLISLSTALILQEKNVGQARQLAVDFIGKKRSPEEEERNLREGRFSYDLMPVQALLSLVELTELVKAQLGQITCPTLIIQAKDDPTVDPQSALMLEKQLGSINKSITWLENSGHVITLGPERQLVTARILDFLSRLEVSYDHYCFGCGEKNTAGLKLKFKREDGKAYTTFTPTENYQGYPGIMHGGITSTILDEIMSQCLQEQGLAGVTARLEIRYRQSIPLHRPINVEARIIKRKGPLVDLEGKVWLDNGQLAAESFGRFMLLGGNNVD